MEKRYFGHIEIPMKRVHLELTNICDFKCVFCPKSVMKREFGYMDTDLSKMIIDEIAENHISEKITFHVMGEPTLHPDFFDILSHASGRGVKVGLTTNGADSAMRQGSVSSSMTCIRSRDSGGSAWPIPTAGSDRKVIPSHPGSSSQCFQSLPLRCSSHFSTNA
jgi:Radical SAM superfamily